MTATRTAAVARQAGRHLRRRRTVAAGLGLALGAVALLATVGGAGEASGGASEPAATPGASLIAHGEGGLQVVLGEQPVVVVTGSGRATVPAETARLELVVVTDVGAASPPARITAEMLAPLVDVLVAHGVSRELIRLVVSPANEADPGLAEGACYGPGCPVRAQVQAEIGSPELDGLRELVRELVTVPLAEGGLAVEYVGVGYGVRDCGPAATLATEAALADARARAAQVARGLDASLGPLLLVASLPAAEDARAPAYGCGGAASGPSGPAFGGAAPPFDPAAPTVVGAEASLTVVFAIVQEPGGEATPPAR